MGHVAEGDGQERGKQVQVAEKHMATDRENLEHFLELMCEECWEGKDNGSPTSFLLRLWETDREAFASLIRGSVEYMADSRGMDGCIVGVCLHIGPETTALVEEIAMKRRANATWGSGFLNAAILLGSKKAVTKFRNGFEKSIACGVRSREYSKNDVLGFVQTVAFLRLESMLDLIQRVAAMKDQQFHRTVKPLWGIPARLMPERRKRWHNYLDDDAIKLAEAVEMYFSKGRAGLRQYLDTISSAEFRERQYLFCLACERNPDDLGYFREQYARYKDPLSKNVCIEAIVYIDPVRASGEFINVELGRFDMDRLLKKTGIHWGWLSIRAHPFLFYHLLTACYYLRELSDGLMSKLELLAGAKEQDTRVEAIMALKNTKTGAFDPKQVDQGLEEVFTSIGSAAHILDMARFSGRLQKMLTESQGDILKKRGS